MTKFSHYAYLLLLILNSKEKYKTDAHINMYFALL